MRDVLESLGTALAQSRATALCRLVETRGSTPQKAGATMLVFADGSQAGTLGGGCVEAEVKRRAIAVLQSGQAEITRFQLDSDYGWDDGLICGGRMQVLIDPVADDASRAYYQQLTDMARRGAGATEVVVFDAAAASLPATACYLFDDEAALVAHVRGPLESGKPPAAVHELVEPLEDRPRPSVHRGLAALPLLRRCRLVIVGGGHVGQAVGQLAAELEFDVWVVDDRAEYVSAERFPRAQQRIAGSVTDVLPKLEINADTYVLIVTRGHNHDEEALQRLCDRGARYVGMIGSHRKIKLIFEDLLEAGIAPEVLDKVHAPVGLDIGSQTVPEIAVSIAAELVAHRNLGGAGRKLEVGCLKHLR